MKDLNKLITLFERYAYAQSYTAAFSTMLDYFLIAFRYYETQEEQNNAIIQLAGYQKKDEHIALLTEIGAQSEGFEDPLGALYEQLVSKGQNGQFFTPAPIATMMGSLVLTEDLKAGQTVYDPACGSGRMLLAAAKINRHLRFYGADLDPLCCKISLVNMLLNSLTGEIAHMNSLTNEFYTGFKVGTVLRDGYHYPYYKEFADPHESYMWLRPIEKPKQTGFNEPFEPVKSDLMSKGIQGNLFGEQ